MRTTNSLNYQFTVSLLIVTLLNTLSGCGVNESQSVREIATQAMHEQAEQNNRIADATRDLVSSDARAREELIESHARLQDQLQKERGSLDQQKKELNKMRETIELDRRRAPVIAEAIQLVGGILVCLVPLFLAGYVLYSVNRVSATDEEHLVNEILIGELTSESPRLLPPVSRLAIANQRSPESVDCSETAPPF
jgi:hypothetical protein